MKDIDGPTAEKHAVDPLEVVHDAIEQAAGLIGMGFALQGRTLFRRRLEEVLRYMCPICGRTDDHETMEGGEHRFVAPHQREVRP